jgi:hypothetical protein
MLRKGLMTALFVIALCALGFAQSFTYQGFLRQSGSPVNGAYDFRFRLWTALVGGSQVGSDQLVEDLGVQNGLFTVQLNFGNVWDGSDRYLEIAVRPGASTGGYQELSPRVRITPTPYAIRALSASPAGAAGGDLGGNYPNPTVTRLQGRAVSTTAPATGQVLKWDGTQWAPASDLFESLWQSSGSNIFYTAGNVGIGTSSPIYRLHVQSATEAITIYGNHTATSGTVYAVYGRSASSTGSGVYGEASAFSGMNYGVQGKSASSEGRGVFGLATASTGANYGVVGGSFSASGTGVFGYVNTTSGQTYGVRGTVTSPDGAGVYGEASATSGVNYGVYGRTASSVGRAVYAEATATSGTTFGEF